MKLIIQFGIDVWRNPPVSPAACGSVVQLELCEPGKQRSDLLLQRHPIGISDRLDDDRLCRFGWL